MTGLQGSEHYARLALEMNRRAAAVSADLDRREFHAMAFTCLELAKSAARVEQAKVSPDSVTLSI